MDKRKRTVNNKRGLNEPKDLNSYLSDVHLISCILIYLSLSEIRTYSFTCKGNRGLTLHLGLIKYKLKEEYSRYFYKNGIGLINEIGEKIRLQVAKGARIISLNLSNTLYESLDENILGPYLEILILEYCRQLKYVSNLGYVKVLCLLVCPKVRDVSGLGKVHKLSIGGEPWNQVYIYFVNQPILEGLEALCNVSELQVKYCTVTDVSPFANIHTLTLSNCPYVTDVSKLSNVYKLRLDNIPVRDVSALTNVKDLNLTWLSLISDVSMLSKVPNLLIIGCKGINNWGSIPHEFGNSLYK